MTNTDIQGLEKMSPGILGCRRTTREVQVILI